MYQVILIEESMFSGEISRTIDKNFHSLEEAKAYLAEWAEIENGRLFKDGTFLSINEFSSVEIVKA